MSILQLKSLTVSIGEHLVCKELCLELEADQVLGVLGRNGVGKTTLLHTLMGFHRAESGQIALLEKVTSSYAPRDLARKLGILLQQSSTTMPATVMETAILGLHPHSDNLLWDKPEDIAWTREVLDLVGLKGFENRQISTLSGGERQRLSLALLFTQAPQLYLLDEPSNHLDIDHQIKMLGLLKNRLSLKSSAAILTSHDINLAVKFCDNILLLLGNGQYIYGSAHEIINEKSLSLAFNCRFHSARFGKDTYFFPA